VLLFEPGLHLVLNRTFKRTAMRLRRFLMDEVLPRMTGKCRPWPGQPSTSLHFVPARGRALDRHALREHRLLAQHELSRRVFQSEALRRAVQTLAHLGRISDDQAQTYEVLAAEIALGIELPGLRIGSPFDEVTNLERQRLADDILRDVRRRARRRASRSAMDAALEHGELATAYPEDDGNDWPRPGDGGHGPSLEDPDPSLDPCSE
jgi:hypothetical protein